MAEHTPGPWTNPWDHLIQGAGGAPVCEVHGQHMSANARLIAAAPELLAALKLAADAIDYAQAQVDSENDRHNLLVRLAQVKRVIAKAEGRGE